MEKGVVVLDNIGKRSEAAIVEESALLVGPESLQRRGSIAFVRRSICLEIVDAYLSSCMHRPAWLGEER